MTTDLTGVVTAALADGSARPLGELVVMAGAPPAQVRACLARMQADGVVQRVASGAHGYYRLAHAMTMAGRVVLHAPRPRLDAQTRFARTCYHHLAGVVGVAWLVACHRHGWLAGTPSRWQPTPVGTTAWARANLVVRAGLEGRDCLDGSERHPHLGGALGVALTRAMGQAGWFTPVVPGRALQPTPLGLDMLRRCGVGIELPD